jgi:hypothetical protein
MEADGGEKMRSAVDNGWPALLGLFAEELNKQP